MARSTDGVEVALLAKPPLLITESATEFSSFQRLRRCKAGIINTAFRAALENLLAQLKRSSSLVPDDLFQGKADALALAWFTDQDCRDEVSELLRQFHLDDSAIEAEAIRVSSADLALLDRMLTSLESRRNKALRCVAEYRHSFAKQLRQSSDRILERKDVLRLEHVADKKSAKA